MPEAALGEDGPTAVVARLAITLDEPAIATPGARVGRYLVIEEIGRGGMGTVLRAYDPKLQREVALKRVHTLDASAHARLVREARAMARLNHANVVAVYDVELGDGSDLVMVMEYVAGSTLNEWLRAQTRTWTAIVEAFVAAGKGLVAAHAEGLLHRDFKLDNVLIGSDGRSRVTDFGLARTADGASRPSLRSAEPHEVASDEPDGSPAFDGVTLELTEAGLVMGTPPYMAPEQHEGLELDARTDQYAFCVGLWRALTQAWPFEGRGQHLLNAKLEGPPGWPSTVAVPRRVVEAIRRGLSPEPRDRWPTLDALLVELVRARDPRRVARSMAAIGIVALAGAGALGIRHLDEQRRIAACTATGSTIDEAWNDEHRHDVRQGLLATGAPHAATTADKLMPWIDDYARAWATSRIDACLDADVRGIWSSETLDRAVWCLDDRRLELSALVTELHNADVQAVTYAVQAAASLPHVQSCRDAALLERLPLPPAEARDEVKAIRRELSRVAALRETGAYDEALKVAEASLARARAAGWPPLVAASRLRVGQLHEKLGAYEAAEAALEVAYFEAATSGAPEEALAAAQTLVYTLGYRLARHAEAERWARHAEVQLALLPDPAGLREATSLNNLAGVRAAMGAHDAAATLLRRALSLREQALGPEHPDVASSLNNLATARMRSGAHDEATALLDRALAIRETILGPTHPEVAMSLNNLGAVHFSTRAYDEAARSFERAIAIWEDTFGPEHADLAMSLNNLAAVYSTMGADAEAMSLYERALAIAEKTLGPEHPEVATALTNLANVRRALGANAEAEPLYERALTITEKAFGPEHPQVATALISLAASRHAMGKSDAAAALYETALAMREAALGKDHAALAKPLLGLAAVALARHRGADAVAFAERAVTVRVAGAVPAHDIAEAHFMLARALVMAGEPRSRARALAEQAIDAYRDAGEAHRDSIAEIESWLRNDADR